MLCALAYLALFSPDAYAVLQKRCVECHAGKEKRAGLAVLDTRALLARGLVVPGKPEESELWCLVTSGAMPPGTATRPTKEERQTLRKWIEDGLPPPDDGIVLARIVADWNALPVARRAEARYVSFHLSDDAARAALDRRLTEFKAGAKLHTVDAAVGVYRLHLSELGWNRRPFRTGPKSKARPSPLDGFDLVLLEYPYSVLPLDVSALAPLLAGRVRPVPFVRGEWLLTLLADESFAGDLAALAGTRRPAAREVASRNVDKARAALELGWRGSAGKLKSALDESGMPELFLGGTVPRAVWAERFSQAASRLDLGTPIFPLDALGIPELPGEGTTRLSASTIEVKTKKATARFWEKDFMEVRITSSRTGTMRLAHFDQDGGVIVPLRKRPLVAGTPFRALDAGNGYEVEKEKGSNRWAIFFLPGAGSELPPATTHWLPGARSRLVHQVQEIIKGRAIAPDDAHRIVKYSVFYTAEGPRK